MKFQDAIRAHIEWSDKLDACLEGRDCGLKADDVARDDRCDIGEWIHGVGGDEFGNLPEFQHVRATHAELHRIAGEMLAAHLKNGATQRLSRMSDQRIRMFKALEELNRVIGHLD